jgi:hypothetical protein
MNNQDIGKSPFGNHNYFVCDLCALNGYPNQKIIYRCEGLRSEDEEGFIIRFAVYDYPIQAGKIHVHKYNEKLICGLVNIALGSGRTSINDG